MNYGDYQPVGDELAAEGGRVTYRACRQGSQRPDFALKVFRPTAEQDEPSPAPRQPRLLDADPCQGFLEAARLQKAVVEGGSRRFAPIHAAGRTEGGAWYATDYYPRGSLKSRIKPDVEHDVGDLSGLVAHTLDGLRDLQRLAGRSHGNLKPANILLGGKSGTPLARTPLFLTDPQPGGDPEALERADLRALGEIILQVVTGREIHSFEDYNYPIRDSQAAEAFGRLGEQGGYWLERCDQLVNPRLSLQQCTLAGLAQDPRLQTPRPVPGWVWTAGAVAGAGVVLGALLVVLLAMRPPRAGSQEIEVAAGKPTAIWLKGSGRPWGALNYTMIEPPRLGSLTGTAPQLVYTPNPDARGTDRFTYKVSQGGKESPPATVTLNFPVPVVVQPTITPNGGSYRDSVLVTLACTNTTAVIYYTLDGREPTTNSTRYNQPFPLTNSSTVTVRASAADHQPSPTVTAKFEVSPTPVVAQPTIIPNGGSYKDSVLVTLACTNTRAAIHYTLDGREPTTNSTRYNQPFPLTATNTVTARAWAPEHKPSPPVSARFEVSPTPVVAQPIITPDGGSYKDSVLVTLACTNTTAVIYYTLDGREPTTNSTRYNQPFPLTGTNTVTVKAWAPGQRPSAPVSARFEVNPTPVVARPTITPNGGRYWDTVQVTLACTNTTAVIYYALNGSEPTTNSTRYSRPFTLTETNTVTAKAWAPDHQPSAQASARFEVSPMPVVAQPTITPNGGSYRDSVLVTLACTNTTAVIYYTLDGREPTTNSTRYRQPFPLTETSTVTAKAWFPDYRPSPAAIARFDINPTPPMAEAQEVSAVAGEPKRITLGGSGRRGATLIYRVVESPRQGIATPVGEGPQLEYTANNTASGTDTFTFTVGDGTRLSAPAMVTLTIENRREAELLKRLEAFKVCFGVKGAKQGQDLTDPVTRLPVRGKLPSGTKVERYRSAFNALMKEFESLGGGNISADQKKALKLVDDAIDNFERWF